MRKELFQLVIAGYLLFTSAAFAQLGIGTTTLDASAVLELNSTEQGLLPPRMTRAQREAISNPADALMIFNTTTRSFEAYDQARAKWTVFGSFKPDPFHLDDHLIANLSFDGSSADIGPNNVIVNNVGNPVFDGIDRHFIPNSAIVFDRTSGIVIPDNPTFNFGTSDFTISCWINTSETKRMMVWQESGVNGSGDNQAWLRLGDNTTERKIRFAVEDAINGSSIINYGGDVVSDGAWLHVVCVGEGGTTRLYIDGVKKSELIKADPRDVSNTQDFKIGLQEGTGGFSNYFEGSLDDFTVYDKALSDAEVASLYQQ